MGTHAEQFAVVAAALLRPQVYGDERDQIIARLNQLQAFCGVGKGYFANASPVDLTLENNFCRFKSVVYSRLTGFTNEEGYVGIVIKRSAEEVERSRQLVIDALFRLLGSKVQLNAQIDSIRPLPDGRCEVVIFVTEGQASGTVRRIPATELLTFLTSAHIKPQLDQLAVECVQLKVDLTDQRLHQYLQAAPPGLDPVVWFQAQADNPFPNRFVPVQLLGFEQLLRRQKLQIQQADWQKDVAKLLADHLEALEQRVSSSRSRIQELRCAQNQLSHQLLRLTASQHSRQRTAATIDQFEEALQSRLEALNVQLDAPMQCKGRVAELTAVVRSQPDALAKTRGRPASSLSVEASDEVFAYLSRCQDTLENLVKTVHADLRDVETLKDLMSNVHQSPSRR